MSSLKPFRWIIATFLVVFLGGYLALSFIPGMLSTQLTLKFEVPVQIGRMGFTPWSISASQFHVGNTPNSVLPEALSIESIEARTPVTEYMKDKITVDSIELDGVYIGLEFDSIKGAKGNWTEIMSNLENNKTEASHKHHKEGKSVFIKKLTIRNIKTDVFYRDKNSGIIHLPAIQEIVLTNISSEGGMFIDQLMSSVLGQMLKSVFVQENLKNMLDQLLSPSQHLDNLISPFKGLFNAQMQEPKEALAVSL